MNDRNLPDEALRFALQELGMDLLLDKRRGFMNALREGKQNVGDLAMQQYLKGVVDALIYFGIGYWALTENQEQEIKREM